ncbi:hypothetical protein EJ06DRAFT_534930 [Trichodelitschia bisporula]|uniref:Uncharacterized protein n=1 Tax=Trichodelitschia bisporula TaxID=703511 RepID=A0A6G1HHI2_9PEZI|nr:hypothetical protein EJ06DRAFT_534930 [Trichodelitschia bisporula]
MASLVRFLLFFSLCYHSSSQFIQRVVWDKVNGVEVPRWRPTSQDQVQAVIQMLINPTLIYNCHYMKTICKNAKK